MRRSRGIRDEVGWIYVYVHVIYICHMYRSQINKSMAE